MSEPARRRPGRPALSPAGSTPVNVRLGAEDYDRLHSRSALERRSIPDLMRRATLQYLAAARSSEDDGDD